MQELSKPEFYKNEYLALYNDLLVLKQIVPSLPTSYYQRISAELSGLKGRLQTSNQKGGFFSNLFKSTTTPISLEIILGLLETVEKKSVLLEDFLACSGKGEKEMILQG